MRIAIMLTVLLFVANVVIGQGARTQVYVAPVTHESGLTDSSGVEKQKAVEAIRKRLSGRRELQLVNERTTNAVVVTVTAAGYEPVWMPTPLAEAKPLQPGEPIPDDSRMAKVARATIAYGTFTTRFAEAAGAFRASAPNNLARRIDEWFKQNAGALARVR